MSIYWVDLYVDFVFVGGSCAVDNWMTESSYDT